jgi:hypothetical protein
LATTTALRPYQLLAADLDCAQVDELALAAHELRAGRFQRLRRPAVVEVSGHPVDALGNFRKVDVPFDARGCEGPGPARLLERLARTQQGLGWDAAPVRALAAHQLALDHGQREAAALEPARDRLAGDAATETHDVKFLRQPQPPPPASARTNRTPNSVPRTNVLEARRIRGAALKVAVMEESVGSEVGARLRGDR